METVLGQIPTAKSRWECFYLTPGAKQWKGRSPPPPRSATVSSYRSMVSWVFLSLFYKPSYHYICCWTSSVFSFSYWFKYLFTIVLLVQGYAELSPRQLLEELFYRIEQAPSWNPTLVECRTIQVETGSAHLLTKCMRLSGIFLSHRNRF